MIILWVKGRTPDPCRTLVQWFLHRAVSTFVEVRWSADVSGEGSLGRNHEEEERHQPSYADEIQPAWRQAAAVLPLPAKKELSLKLPSATIAVAAALASVFSGSLAAQENQSTVDEGPSAFFRSFSFHYPMYFLLGIALSR